jgi:hypothetical protein
VHEFVIVVVAFVDAPAKVAHQTVRFRYRIASQSEKIIVLLVGNDD